MAIAASAPAWSGIARRTNAADQLGIDRNLVGVKGMSHSKPPFNLWTR